MKVLDLLKAMRANAAEEGWPVWKNIPLAKEYLAALTNPEEELNGTDIEAFCDAIFLEDLIDQRSNPRLCLEFLKLRAKAIGIKRPDEEPYEEQFVLSDEDAKDLQQKWEDFIGSELSMEQWKTRYHAHLKFDPVERTEQWEAVIYDVEKECDKRLKGSSRGMGFCFEYWAVKASVLSSMGIEWNSPSRMNPGVMFD